MIIRLYYTLRAKWKRWNFKRKYGRDIDEVVMEYGKDIKLTDRK